MRPLVGLAFVAFGGVLIFGGATGRLAPMLAALFYPSALGPAKHSSQSPLGKIPSPPFKIFPTVPGVPGGPITGIPFSPISTEQGA